MWNTPGVHAGSVRGNPAPTGVSGPDMCVESHVERATTSGTYRPRRTEAPAPTSGTGSLDSRSDDRRLAIPRATGCGGQPAGRQGRTVQRLLVTTPWFAPTDQMWPGHHD